MNDLLQFYLNAGVDVVIDNAPYDRFNPRPAPVIVTPPPPIQNSARAELVVQTTPLKKAVAKTIATKAPSHPADTCKTLDDLRNAMANYKECSLSLTATNMVFSDGVPTSKVMIIGEAPGADEDRQGIPFVGQSGQLLDKIFKTIGLSRTENLYIANIVPWRPPGNRPPTSQEIAQCEPFIRKHIELIRPEFVVLLGGVAAKTLLKSTDGVMKLRGALYDIQLNDSLVVKALPTLHPAYLMRSPGQKAHAWRDMLFLKESLVRV